MTSADSASCREMYQRLYMTRPLSIGLPKVLLTLTLLPALFALAWVRLLNFWLFNAAYLVLPRALWRGLLRSDWLHRPILFLTTGIVFRTPGFHGDAGSSRRLVVMNHHGVQDVFLFQFFQRIGVTRLVVSYTPDFYARMRRWVFFCDHDFDIVSVLKRRELVRAGPHDVTMVFPEGAGKKGPFVLKFQPAMFRLHGEVAPFAVSFKQAIPLLDAYGVDLPWHKFACFLLLILSPWTVVTVRQLPPLRFDRRNPAEASVRCRDVIANAAGYCALDLLFDQGAFDACVDSSVRRNKTFSCAG
jgi:hypothetical protein